MVTWTLGRGLALVSCESIFDIISKEGYLSLWYSSYQKEVVGSFIGNQAASNK